MSRESLEEDLSEVLSEALESGLTSTGKFGFFTASSADHFELHLAWKKRRGHRSMKALQRGRPQPEELSMTTIPVREATDAEEQAYVAVATQANRRWRRIFTTDSSKTLRVIQRWGPRLGIALIVVGGLAWLYAAAMLSLQALAYVFATNPYLFWFVVGGGFAAGVGIGYFRVGPMIEAELSA